MQSPPNLLVSLFDWHPRDGVKPAENFLTEAFVHSLRSNEDFRRRWLERLVNAEFDNAAVVISTRASYSDIERQSSIFPDIEIQGDLSDGSPFLVLVEIKWDAPYQLAQLKKYDRLLAREENGYLCFICASGTDHRKAKADRDRFENSTFSAFLWEDVFVALRESIPDHASKELLGFMQHYGLTPGEPISQNIIDGYLVGKSLVSRLNRYCEKLLREFDWDFLPETHRDIDAARVKNAYGRVAIEFAPPYWDGAVTVGFLYDNSDHAVPFADGSQNSVDLIFRIEAAPKAPAREDVNAVIRPRVSSVRAKGGVVRLDKDGINGNRHTLFIAQRSLSDFLASPVEGDQLVAIHNQLKAWAEALFGDQRVEEALLKFAPA
ncbi:hypothetical protein [Pseudorhizobium flavum]|uniref:hypothetical protein n=1 Tax=Pseudorhizobium flavum TaxID=1335061 RepID=UPI00376FCD51